MGYGRQSLMNGLRMAGDKVRSFDDAYASKLANYIGSFNPAKNSVGQYIQGAAGLSAGVPATRRFDVGPVENTMPGAQFLHGAVEYGVPALNAGVRYGIPALGAVGTANILGGIYDAASEVQLYDEDGQTPGTLPM